MSHPSTVFVAGSRQISRLPTEVRIRLDTGAKGFDYYSLKDRAMAEAAEYGLMLWDGKSKGTVNNVVNLTREHKPVVVYVAPTTQFRTIRTSDDLRDLLAQGDSDSVERIVSELHLYVLQHGAAGQNAVSGVRR